MSLTAIEVQSSVLSNTVSESQYPIAIIGQSDISSSQSIGSNVGSNINSIPGVSNSDYGTAVGQPVIRGLSGSRVRILSNSNIVNDLSYFSADHAKYG
jgi:iron complex outermembrane receptor protein